MIFFDAISSKEGQLSSPLKTLTGHQNKRSASVAQLDAHPTGDLEVRGSYPTRSATFLREY